MKKFEEEQNKKIRKFVREGDLTKTALKFFLKEEIIHSELEIEFARIVADNATEITHSYLISLSKKNQVAFIQALSKLLSVSVSIKLWEYLLSREDAPWFWEKNPTYFMSLTHMIEPLQQMLIHIKQIEKWRGTPKILLVEGITEYNFLTQIQSRTQISNLEMEVINYGGKGNIQNLTHLIKDLNSQGKSVLLSFDKDSQSPSFLSKLKKHKCKIHRTFGFKRDFETAFPLKVLHLALETYCARYLKKPFPLSLRELGALRRDTKPILKILEEKGILSVQKPKLGKIFAELMDYPLIYDNREIFNWRDKKKVPEIFEFIRFLIK